MRNLGKVSLGYLRQIGVCCLEDLEKHGSVKCYKIIKSLYPRQVSLNLLWSLEGAIRDCDWKELSQEVKQKLILQLG
ncbi:MAG: TfoX/Sxy family DNA transformation protein [Deltaproteobacteria bacterium]|nr:TfoX/Sxy family DNA transformation protein [Deltaproteobacteria bacterium]